MKILILGGTGFVGRTTAEVAVTQGHDVTVLNRGRRDGPPGVRTLAGDRTTPGGLDALNGHDYDAVIDTWSAAPSAVRDSARHLSGHAGHYGYVSSRSVYQTPDTGPLAEDTALVDGDPDADSTNYPADKRGAEIATRNFDGPVLLARAGLILGPHEDVGRLPWWLNRLHRGGHTLAPGPRDLPLQYIDARDLAQFLLDAAAQQLTGPYNLVSAPGHTTMGELLDTANEITGGNADLRWTDPGTIAAAGIEPWIQLPIWLPPGHEAEFMHHGNVRKALDAGLHIRPVRDTIADTWTWMRSPAGATAPPHPRAAEGLDPATEAKVLGLS